MKLKEWCLMMYRQIQAQMLIEGSFSDLFYFLYNEEAFVIVIFRFINTSR